MCTRPCVFCSKLSNYYNRFRLIWGAATSESLLFFIPLYILTLVLMSHFFFCLLFQLPCRLNKISTYFVTDLVKRYILIQLTFLPTWLPNQSLRFQFAVVSLIFPRFLAKHVLRHQVTPSIQMNGNSCFIIQIRNTLLTPMYANLNDN